MVEWDQAVRLWGFREEVEDMNLTTYKPAAKRAAKVILGAFISGGLLAVADSLGIVVPDTFLGIPVLAYLTALVLSLEKASEVVFGRNL